MSAISIAVTQVPVREISRAVDRGRGAIAIAISVAWVSVAIIVGWIRLIICIGGVPVPVSGIAVSITVIGSSQRRSDERTCCKPKPNSAPSPTAMAPTAMPPTATAPAAMPPSGGLSWNR
jgi:hypothetical protein